MNNKAKNQDPISNEDLHTFLTYVLTRKLDDKKHAKQIKRLSRRTTTLSDVTVVAKTIQQATANDIVEIMDVIQIMRIVLEKLGATEEMFQEAKVEYDKMIAEAQEEMQKLLEASQKVEKEEVKELDEN